MASTPELTNAPANFKSKIWEHFGFRFKYDDAGKKEPVKETTTCKRCYEDVSYKAGNTTNMAHHMRRHHPNVDLTACSRIVRIPKHVTSKTGAESERSTVTGQLRLQDAFKQKMPHNAPRSLAITRAVGKFLAGDLRSFSLVESPHFMTLISTLDPKYQLSSRVHFSQKVIPELYNETVVKVKESLKGAQGISLTTDGWTSRATQSYVTVTAHYISADWELNCVVLQTRELSESHTAENLAVVLKGAIKEWNIQRTFSCCDPVTHLTTFQPKPIAITSDNAQNVVKGIDIAGLQPHTRCFAHCLNLSAQKAIDITSVARLLGRMRRVVTFFHHSSTATKVLSDKQKALGLPIHKLIQDVKTRWNSSFDMTERYLEQQPAIYAALKDAGIKRNLKDLVTLSEDDIRQAEALVVILRPLKTITTLICSEHRPTVSMIHPLRERLLRCLISSDDEDSTMITQVKDALKNDLTARYTDPLIVEVLEISCAMDPRFHTLPYHENHDRERVYDAILNRILAAENMTLVKQEPCDLVQTAPLTTELPDLPSLPEQPLPDSDQPCYMAADLANSPPRKKSAMEDLFGDVFVVKETPAVSISLRARDEIRGYRAESSLPLDSNPLSWWKEKEGKYPLLSNLAKDYLCIQGTSVPSERVFSTAGDIVSAQRSLLDPGTVDKLIFLKKNL